MAEIKKIIKKNPLQTITVAIAIIGVVFSIFNFYILASMAPLAKQIAVLDTEVQANTQLDTQEHSTFVNMDTFNEVVTRIDHISNRVDSIYNIVAQNK